MSGTRSAFPRAPVTDPRLSGAALLTCSHGWRSGRAGLSLRARALAQRAGFAQAAACSLYGEPSLEEALAAITADPVMLVPLFMCEGVTLNALRQRTNALTGNKRVVLCPILGSHPDLAGRVAADAGDEAAARGWAPRETALLLIGHGSKRHAASGEAVGALARSIDRLGQFDEVAQAFLEQSPSIAEALAALRCRQAVAVGCFTEWGRHAGHDVPQALAGAQLPTAYAGPLGTADWIVHLVIDQAQRGAGHLTGAKLAS